MIHEARTDELNTLRDIESVAGCAFRDLGMGEIADDEPLTIDELAAFQKDGRAWVSVDESGHPVAYLLVQRVDSSAHIEQVSVHPGHARRGLGKALIDFAASWARHHNLTGLTLTTFEQVPWNAPYYRRLGFRVLDETHITRGLRAIRSHEARLGLDRWPRVVMRKDLRHIP